MLQSKSNRIEFIEDAHIYLIDGIIVPSVSELLKRIFPNKYKGVPKAVLNAKAQYGSVVHDAIECLEKGRELPKMNIYQQLAIEQYQKLKDEHGFHVVKQEEMVCYEDKYCGRYDMIIDNKEYYRCLADIKTTAQLDKDALSWQLSFYELAYEYTFGTKQFPFKKFYCLWFPRNNLGEFVEIERIKRDVLLKKLDEIL